MTLKSAIGMLIQLAPKPRTEKVFLCDALDKVSAEDLYSDINFPPFDRAAGNIVCAVISDEDLTVKIIGESYAGESTIRTLKNGEALICFSGAPIPQDVNFFFKYSESMQIGDIIEIEHIKSINKLEEISSICTKGDLLLSQGTRITPAHLPLFAQSGTYEPVIYSKPIVTHFSIGSELVEPPFTPRFGQIRNTNSTFLNSLLKKSNANSDYLGLVPDNLEKIKAFINEGFETSDIVMISGGTASGKYDLTKQAILECGFEIAFDKVDIHPGKNTIFAHRNNQVILALPGKPLAMLVAFQMIAKPLIAYSSGSEPKAMNLKLELVELIDHNIKKYPLYLPGTITADSCVKMLPFKHFSNTVSIAKCNCLIVAQNAEEMQVGNHVNCMLISEFLP